MSKKHETVAVVERERERERERAIFYTTEQACCNTSTNNLINEEISYIINKGNRH